MSPIGLACRFSRFGVVVIDEAPAVGINSGLAAGVLRMARTLGFGVAR